MACLFIWEVCNKCCRVEEKKNRSQLTANIFNSINLSSKYPRLWTDLYFYYSNTYCTFSSKATQLYFFRFILRPLNFVTGCTVLLFCTKNCDVELKFAKKTINDRICLNYEQYTSLSTKKYQCILLSLNVVINAPKFLFDCYLAHKEFFNFCKYKILSWVTIELGIHIAHSRICLFRSTYIPLCQ